VALSAGFVRHTCFPVRCLTYLLDGGVVVHMATEETTVTVTQFTDPICT